MVKPYIPLPPLDSAMAAAATTVPAATTAAAAAAATAAAATSTAAISTLLPGCLDYKNKNSGKNQSKRQQPTPIKRWATTSQPTTAVANNKVLP